MKTHVWIGSDRWGDLSRLENVDGVDMVITLSPYLAPQSIWSDQTDHHLNFGFSYIDREPEGIQTSFGNVTLTEGRYSGKLLSLSIPWNGTRDDPERSRELKSHILEAFAQRETRLDDKIDRQLNQQVIGQVIEENWDRLVHLPLAIQ